MEDNNYEQVTPTETRKDPDYATISGADKHKPVSRKPRTMIRMLACIIALVVVCILMEIYIIYATLPKQPKVKPEERGDVTLPPTKALGTSPPTEMKTSETTVNEVNPSRETGSPDWESDWIEMQSQSLQGSYRVVEHHLEEVPIKVKVLVKPISGPNADFVFEASSQQETDDDYPETYCGVVYFYDHQQVDIRVPMKNNYKASGISFCTGNGWSDGYSAHEQTSGTVIVKVLAWKSSSFPDPQLMTPWTYIGEGRPFVEIPHNTETKPLYVHLQFRCNITSNLLYGEGTSRAADVSGVDNNAGIVYAVSSNLVRIWILGKIGEAGKQVMSAVDGYGPPSQQVGCTNGEFRVYGWTSLGSLMYEHSLILTTEIIKDTELLKVLTTVLLRSTDTDNFVTVQVTPLSGRNTNFTFTSVGQIQRTARGVQYGGLAFGYSDTELRMYVPVTALGAVSIIDDAWGDGHFADLTNTTRIDVRIWKL